MSRALSEEEKKERQLKRDQRTIYKELHPELDERCYEILRILREAPQHPEVKYNSIYFEKHCNRQLFFLVDRFEIYSK